MPFFVSVGANAGHRLQLTLLEVDALIVVVVECASSAAQRTRVHSFLLNTLVGLNNKLLRVV